MKKNPTSLNPVKTVFSAGGGFFLPVETRTAHRGRTPWGTTPKRYRARIAKSGRVSGYSVPACSSPRARLEMLGLSMNTQRVPVRLQ